MLRKAILAFSIAGLLAAGNSPAATIEGRIVSERINNFEDFVVYIKRADPESFTVDKKPQLSVQKDMKIIPKIMPVVRRSNVTFANHDKELHNLHTTLGSAVYFNIGIPPGLKSGPIRFPREGEVTLLCDVHPQIIGYILVLQNPYFAKADADGGFTITGVPAGEYDLMTWHDEYKSFSKKVLVKHKDETASARFEY